MSDTAEGEAARRTRRPFILSTWLVGCLLLLAGWTAATTSSASESTDLCPSVLGRWLLEQQELPQYCAARVSDREVGVLLLTGFGVLLMVFACWRGGRGLFARANIVGRVSIRVRMTLLILGLTTILWALPVVAITYPWLAADRSWDDLVRGGLPVTLAAATLMVVAVATKVGRVQERLGIDHAMSAASLALPLMVLTMVDLYEHGHPDSGGISPTWALDPMRILITGVPIAVALVVFAYGQGHGWPVPPAAISGTALLMSAAALMVAVTPEAFHGGWGVSSAQAGGRYLLWLDVAVVTPFGLFTAWWRASRTLEKTASPV